MPAAHVFEDITETAWLTAYPRIFTDIPYAREIFKEMEILREEEGGSKFPDQVGLRLRAESRQGGVLWAETHAARR